MDAKVFADDQPDIPGHAVLFEENIVFADDNVQNWIIKWTGWDDVPFDINGDGLSFGPFCFEDCNLESLTLYSLSLPVYDHDPNIAENMKFLLYGGHVQTLYTHY